jgi:uncharacterized Tic20 family protein
MHKQQLIFIFLSFLELFSIFFLLFLVHCSFLLQVADLTVVNLAVVIAVDGPVSA